MKPTQTLLDDLARITREAGEHEREARSTLNQLLLEAKQHPRITMETAARIAGVSYVNAYERAKEAECKSTEEDR